MVQVVEVNIENEFVQCRSCFENNKSDTEFFKIIIGKNAGQSICINLCKECMRDLKMELDNLEINGKLL